MRKIRKIIIIIVIVLVVAALVTGGAFACTSSKSTWTNNDDDTIYTDVVQDIYAGYDGYDGYDWEYYETTPSVTDEENPDLSNVAGADTDDDDAGVYLYGEDETDEYSDSGDDSYSSNYGYGNYPYTGQIALNEAQENMKGCLDWASLNASWQEQEIVSDDVLALDMLACLNFTNPSVKFTLLEDRNIGTDFVYSEAFMCQLVSAYVPDYDGDLEASLAAFNKEYTSWNLKLENGVVNYVDGGSMGELGQGADYDFYITSWTDNADGIITVEAQRTYYNIYLYDDSFWEDPQTTCTYRFELVPNSYTEGMDDPIFEYSIESVEYLGNYFLLDSDTHYWAESEIAGVAKWIARCVSSDDATNYKKALRFMRNEIYARHGAIFLDSELQGYFEEQPWYTPKVAVANFNDNDLNDCEHANIEAILDLEAAGG